MMPAVPVIRFSAYRTGDRMKIHLSNQPLRYNEIKSENI